MFTRKISTKKARFTTFLNLGQNSVNAFEIRYSYATKGATSTAAASTGATITGATSTGATTTGATCTGATSTVASSTSVGSTGAI